MRLWSHPLLACHSPSPSLRFIFLSSPCVSLAFAWILAFFCQVQHTHKHTSSIYINTHTFILSLAFLPPHFVSKDSTGEPLTHTLTHIHFSCKWFPDLHFIHRHTHTITPRRTYITSCVIQGLKTIVLLFRQCGHCCSLNLQSLQWMSFFFLSFFLVYVLPFAYVCGVQYSWVSREPMKTTMRRAGSRVVGAHATNAVDPGSNTAGGLVLHVTSLSPSPFWSIHCQVKVSMPQKSL